MQRLNRFRTYLAAPGLGPLFVRSVAGSGAIRIASMLASFGVGVQLARGLGVEGYGYYGLALSVITIAGIPGELGLSKLVTRETSAAAARNDQTALPGIISWASRTCWRISALASFAVFVAALVLLATGSFALAITVLAGVASIPFVALSRVKGGALQGLQFIILGQIPANLLRPLFLSMLLFAVYLAHAMSPTAAMAMNSVSAVGAAAVAGAWLSARTPRAHSEAPAAEPRSWLLSIIPFALSDGMRMLQLELTTVLLGLMTMPASVGLFRIAVVTATIAAAPLIVLIHATMPMISSLHAQQDRVRLQKLLTHSAWAQTAGVLVLSLPLLIAPGLLLSVVFGDGFAAAALPTRIIAAGQIINAAFGSNVMVLNMTYNERRVTRAMGIGLAVNVTVVLLLSRMFGTAGAALGFVASVLCWNILTWRDARRLLGVDTSLLSMQALQPRAS